MICNGVKDFLAGKLKCKALTGTFKAFIITQVYISLHCQLGDKRQNYYLFRSLYIDKTYGKMLSIDT